jgi:hypothetical protein
MKCLRRSLHTHGTLFDKPTYHTKPTHGFELDIQIPHGTPPIRVAPRHACKPQRDIMEQYIDKHKKSGLIEDSVSPWAAPVILTLKKDGTHRVVLDYRGLNRISNAPSSFPLIRADDQLQALAGSKYLSCIDLTSAYHNIKLHRGPLPIHTTPYGTFAKHEHLQRVCTQLIQRVVMEVSRILRR